MTSIEQNKAVAEWLDWTEIRELLGDLKGVPPSDWPSDLGFDGQAWVPDFGRDLNAIHAAVERLRHLDGLEWFDFQTILKDECGSWMNCIQATAAQRREALLRTLNLWKS